MSWINNLFHTERPIIGLLHLRALPGDPFFPPCGTIDEVIEAAKADLIALQEGGVDGVLITNEFSLPYEKKVSPVTIASIAMVVGALRELFTVPYGVEAIYDGDATIEVCAATGASFTRCTVDPAVDKVTEHEVDDPVLAAEGHSRFCAFMGQWCKSCSFAAGEDHTEYRCSHNFCLLVILGSQVRCILL